MRRYKTLTQNTSFPLQSPQKDVDLHLRPQKQRPPNPPRKRRSDGVVMLRRHGAYARAAQIGSSCDDSGENAGTSGRCLLGMGSCVGGRLCFTRALCNRPLQCALLHCPLCNGLCRGVPPLRHVPLVVHVVPMFGAQRVAAQGAVGRTGSLASA